MSSKHAVTKAQKKRTDLVRFFCSQMAEGVRFELTVGCPTSVFKTGALNHSATPPCAFDCWEEESVML